MRKNHDLKVLLSRQERHLQGKPDCAERAFHVFSIKNSKFSFSTTACVKIVAESSKKTKESIVVAEIELGGSKSLRAPRLFLLLAIVRLLIAD